MFIGVDIGGTNIRVATGNSNGKIKEKISGRTPLKGGLPIPKKIEEMIKEISDGEKIESIGISSFGPLNINKGILVARHHIKRGKIPLVPYIRKKFKVKTTLLNDCVAAVLAEKHIGSGRKTDNLVYITMSTGIGAGIITDGHLLCGKDGNAHEVGHITVERNGLRCSCGGIGHWEAYTAGKNFTRFASHILKRKVDLTAEEIFRKSKSNASFRKVVNEAGKINAIGVSNVVNAYDPELITLGGAVVMRNKKEIINPIKKHAKKNCLNRVPKIKATGLGEDICLNGALIASSKL